MPIEFRPALFRPVPCFRDLLASDGAAIVQMAAADHPSVNRPLLFPEWANDEIRASHSAPSETGPVELGVIRDAIISGASIVRTPTFVYLLDRICPYYVQYYLTNRLVNPVSYDLAGRRAIEVGDAFLVTHFNSGVYGHWLLEGLPKLLWMHVNLSNLPVFENPTFIIHRSAPPFVSAWMRLLFPKAAIISYDPDSEYVIASRLFLPSLMFSSSYFFHPILNEAINTTVQRLRNPEHRITRKAIYLTRTWQSHYREMSNRHEIEAVAAEAGLTLVAPETMSIPDQIALFGQAKLVCGEYGSALHNLLFAGADVTTIGLNWVNSCQSRISQLRGQTTSFIVPDTGIATKFQMKSEKSYYSINPKKFSDALQFIIPLIRN